MAIEMRQGATIRIKGNPNVRVRLVRNCYVAWPGFCPEGPIDMPLFRYEIKGKTDDEGYCEFRAIPPANYHLHASAWAQFDVKEGEIVKLNLIKKGNIRLFGKVTDAGGNPIPSAAGRITGQGVFEPQMQLDRNCCVLTDENGCYQMLHLLPGEYKLGCRDVSVEENINIPEGQAGLRYDVWTR